MARAGGPLRLEPPDLPPDIQYVPSAANLRPLFAIALAVGAAGCLPSAGPRPSAAPAYRLDTLFYVSARARDEGRETARLSDTLEYGLVIGAQRLSDGDDATVRIVDSTFVTRRDFIALLGARLRDSDDRFALLYTHGYGTSLREAWSHSLTSRSRSGGHEPWVVFAWPSIGSGVAWPRAGELFTSAYRQDSASAAQSEAAYAEALQGVLLAAGGSRVMVVAHSLGGQLVSAALMRKGPLREALEADPLRAVAFVSTDIAAERFTDVVVPELRPVTQRLVLYASADDRVLAVSQMVNDSERAGRFSDAERGPIVAPGLESVDMTDGAFADSRLMHAVGTRHALRRKRDALFDLIHVVGAGRTADDRALLGSAERLPSGAWRLLPGGVPPSPR